MKTLLCDNGMHFQGKLQNNEECIYSMLRILQGTDILSQIVVQFVHLTMKQHCIYDDTSTCIQDPKYKALNI